MRAMNRPLFTLQEGAVGAAGRWAEEAARRPKGEVEAEQCQNTAGSRPTVLEQRHREGRSRLEAAEVSQEQHRNQECKERRPDSQHSLQHPEEQQLELGAKEQLQGLKVALAHLHSCCFVHHRSRCPHRRADPGHDHRGLSPKVQVHRTGHLEVVRHRSRPCRCCGFAKEQAHQSVRAAKASCHRR